MPVYVYIVFVLQFLIWMIVIPTHVKEVRTALIYAMITHVIVVLEEWTKTVKVRVFYIKHLTQLRSTEHIGSHFRHNIAVFT